MKNNILNILDLGKIKGPLLIFGGPCSNLQATQAVLNIAVIKNIPQQNIFCTGDIAAYCAQPEETAKLLRNSGIHIIKGNCEESFSADLDNCGCGFNQETICELLSKQWFDYAKKQLSTDIKRWMGALPDRIIFEYSGKRFHMLHGSHTSINEFIFASTDDIYKAKHIEQTGADVVLCGHSGLPFTSVINNKIWHNSGIIGIPANDGTPRVWYSIIEKQNGQIVITHNALDYDIESAHDKMLETGLTTYGKTLRTGLWPSLDILPQMEGALTGKALQENKIIF